jgi:hypothetical protein
MITCDYCGEEITDNTIGIGAVGVDPLTERFHVDLHIECIALFGKEAKKVKGKRPKKNDPTTT